jgi:hypothetical protein
MSIYRDQLYYDNASNTITVNADLTCTGLCASPNYSISSTTPGTQSIPSGTATAIAFTTDTRTNWPVRTNNTRFVAPVSGKYLVSVQCGYATPPGTAGINKLLVFLNTTLIGEQSFPYATAVNIFNWSGIASMNGTTDYITAQLLQASGGAVSSGGANPEGGNINKITLDRLHSN